MRRTVFNVCLSFITSRRNEKLEIFHFHFIRTFLYVVQRRSKTLFRKKSPAGEIECESWPCDE